MTLTALKDKRPQKQTIVKTASLPSPTRGWYVGENLASSPAGTAYALNNAFPELDYVRVRGGSIPFATGMGSGVVVNSLMLWEGGQTFKIFAGADNKIYDVTNTGPVGAALVTGLLNSTFQYMQFTGTGGSWIMAVNGQDPAQLFNGTTWVTAPAITGLTGNNFSFVWGYNHRIYGIERNSLNYWYLPIDSIGGAATKIDMSGIFTVGGQLLCGGTWSLYSSTGALTNACVFVTTEGEAAVYVGDYPGAANWTYTGVYKMSRPLGNQCLLKAGGDLAVLTEDGIVALSQAVQLDQVALQNAAITLPISPVWVQAAQDRTGKTGWQIVSWPLRSFVVVNLPKATASDKTQFVVNSRTGAWCQYLGWDANCFVVAGSTLTTTSLYYGTSDGRTMLAETGGQDDGMSYTAAIFPSFSNFGAPVQAAVNFGQPVLNKQTRLVRPNIQSTQTITPTITIKVDFDTIMPPNPGPYPVSAQGAVWDVAIWDVSKWGGSLTNQLSWTGAFGYGAFLSPVIQISFNQATLPDVRLTATDVMWEEGDVLG